MLHGLIRKTLDRIRVSITYGWFLVSLPGGLNNPPQGVPSMGRI
jgi:hypothetical protein